MIPGFFRQMLKALARRLEPPAAAQERAEATLRELALPGPVMEPELELALARLRLVEEMVAQRLATLASPSSPGMKPAPGPTRH